MSRPLANILVRGESMQPKIRPALLTVRLFLVLLLALIALQVTGGIGYAAPIQTLQSSSTVASASPFICTNLVSNQFCNVRVVLLIDDTGSMRTNDPTKIRNQGAKNLVDILDKEYYQQAVAAQQSDPNVVLPDVQVAVIHFSHCDTTNHLCPADVKFPDVKFNSGWHSITQKQEIYQDIDWLSTQPHYYDVPQYTHFPGPFQAAAALFDQPAAAITGDCTKRFMLLLTDGTPENAAGPLQGSALTNEMDQVKAAVKSFIAQPNDQIYVTAFKIASNYWSQVEPLWKATDLAGPSNVTLEKSLDAVASRMEQIVTAMIGAQTSTLSPEPNNPKLFNLTVLPHTTSLRISYFKLDPHATLTLKDPQGNDLVPNSDSVTQTGKDTSIEVWTLKDPAPGIYQVLRSTSNGIITTTPVFNVNARLTAPIADAPLLQFTPGLIRFDLVDSQGKPVLPNDFPANFNLSVTSDLVQGTATTPLTLTQNGSDYETNWTPLSTDPGSVTVNVDLTDANHTSILKCQGGIGDFKIDPVKVKVTAPTACTEVNSSVVVPLQVVNERTGQNAGLGLPIQWQADSVTSSSGQPVDSPVETVDAKTGQYQLTLTPLIYEDINSHISASVSADNQNVPLFDGNVTIPVCAAPTTPTPTPTPIPPPPPPSSCKLNPFWNYLLWIIALILAIILLVRLAFSKREKEHIIPSWLLVLLLILLLLLWLFWCSINIFWLLLLLLLLLLIIILLIRIVTHDKDWRISIWFWLYVILLILLIVIWLVYYSSLWIYLLLMLLILFIILLILWWISDRDKEEEPFSFWWLLILFIFLISIWMIFLGSFGLWLILILLLIWLFVLYLIWLIVQAGEERSSTRFWLTLFLMLLLVLIWVFLFSAYWVYLAVLLLILLLIGFILWMLMGYHNNLWGVIGIIDEKERLLWSAPLGDRNFANGKSSYDWKFDEPVCSVKRLRIRSWDKPNHRLTIFVDIVDDGRKRRFIRSLEDWQDCELHGCRIVWMKEIPSPRPKPRKPRVGGSYPIEKIEGIGKVYGSKFRELGIRTTDQFLKAAGTPKGRREVAKSMGVSAKLILEWVNRADLMRVPGIGEEYSDLLEASGVDTVKELRRRNAANLYAEVCKVNKQKYLVRRDPTLKEVSDWINAAQKMKAAVEY